MNVLDKIYSENKDSTGFAMAYVEHLCALLRSLDMEKVSAFISTVLHARENGCKIFFAGNGGSAATASHFANDMAIGTKSVHKPFKAIALTDNMAAISAIANDYGYDHIFVKQLEALMEPGDVLVTISASGNSQNVVDAVEFAKQQGSTTIALVGFDGGKLAELCDIVLLAKTAKGEYGPVEDIHMILDHLIHSYLLRHIAAEQP